MLSYQPNIPPELIDVIKEADDVLLAAHIGLDGDHLGSMIALGEALRLMGKKVVSYLPETVPENYHFLQGLDKLSPTLPDRVFDLLITLECPNVARLPKGVDVKKSAKVVVNLDHHPDNENYGDHLWIEPDAAALGEMIFDLLYSLDVKLNKTMALGIYVAILTDTGSFQYSRVRPATHRRLAVLLEHKLPTDLISRSIYRHSRHEVLRLLGQVLSTVNLTPDRRVAWAEISATQMQELGVRPEDAQFFIDDVDRVAGPEVVALFREIGSNRVKVSLRSKYAAVNTVAAKFGGGGHPRAAGCVVEGALGEVRKKVVEAVSHSLEVGV